MKTKKLVSLLLALIMMFSAVCSLNMTALAQKTYDNQSAVNICTIEGRIGSGITAINDEKITLGYFGCVEVQITSDSAINYSLVKNSADVDNAAVVKTDIVNSKVKLWNAKGTYLIKLSKGTKSFGKSVKYKIKFINRTPKTVIKRMISKRKSFTVCWAKKPGVTSYQIMYSTNKKFKGAKKITVKGANSSARTIKKLKAKKLYYVKVRTCKADQKHREYGPWSGTRVVRTF